MTGAEHYAEAERLLAEAARHEAFIPDSSNIGRITRERELADKKTALAQVHATLALAEIGAAVAERSGLLYVNGPFTWPSNQPANPGEGRTDG